MWVFTQHGFYSVVAAKPSKDRSGELKKMGVTSDDTHVLVRARVGKDLEDLRDTYYSDLQIFEDKGADYTHRVYMTRERWKAILAVAVDELDYDSHFKEAHRDGTMGTGDRYGSVMSVWSAMMRLQSVKPYSGGSTGWSGSGGTYGNSQFKGTYGQGHKDDGKPLGHKRTQKEGYAAGYSWDAQEKCYVKKYMGVVDKKAEPTSTSVTTGGATVTSVTSRKAGDRVTVENPTSLSVCRAMLMGKAPEDFTTSEVQRLSNDAFELWERASELPPSKLPATSAWLDEQIQEIEELNLLLPGGTWADDGAEGAAAAEETLASAPSEDPSLDDLLEDIDRQVALADEAQASAPEVTVPGTDLVPVTEETVGTAKIWDPKQRKMVPYGGPPF